MSKFLWVSGQLAEVQRFINVPMRWCEQYPARERRELWVTTGQGEEFKLVAQTRVMPARRGHQVVGVLLDGQLVGLRNLTTGERVNFVRSEPPLLWRRCDGVAIALLVAADAVAWGAGWPAAGAVVALAALLYGPALIGTRWHRRWSLARLVDGAIDSAQRQATGDRRLRRVKWPVESRR